MFLQQGGGSLNIGSVQLAQGSSVQPGTPLTMQGLVVPAGILQGNLTTTQQHSVTQQTQPAQPQQQNILREQTGTHTQVRHHTHTGETSIIYKQQNKEGKISICCNFMKLYYYWEDVHCGVRVYPAGSDSVSSSLHQSQRLSHTLQSPQGALPASLYNTMMISQPGQANVVQISTSLAQNSPSGTTVATFSQDRQLRYLFIPLQRYVTTLHTFYCVWYFIV